MDEVLAAHEGAWNAPNGVERRLLLALAWVEDGVFIGNEARLEGVDAIARHIDGFRARFPGARIAVSRDYRQHDELAWLTVRITLPDGCLGWLVHPCEHSGQCDDGSVISRARRRLTNALA